MADNPYQAPEALGPARREPFRKPGALRRGLAWTALVGLNLPVPLALGWTLTQRAGRVGMWAGVLAYAAGGWAVMAGVPPFAQTLNAGAVVVAFSQFVPALQIFAGAIGVGVARALGQVGERDFLASEAGGLIATVVTGAVLVGVAILLGFAIRAFTPRRWWHDDPPLGPGSADPDGRPGGVVLE